MAIFIKSTVKILGGADINVEVDGFESLGASNE
jgi:hypothetical protein